MNRHATFAAQLAVIGLVAAIVFGFELPWWLAYFSLIALVIGPLVSE